MTRTGQNLTERQQQVLTFIKDYSRAMGYPPSVREIGKEVGLKSSSTVHSHLNSLEMKGYIRREESAARAIVVLDRSRDANGTGGAGGTGGVDSVDGPDGVYTNGLAAIDSRSTGENDRHPLSATDIARKVVVLPLVGRVAAGSPILATENVEDSFVLPRNLMGDTGSFLLTIHGDSMIEAGINDGDYVVVREQCTANNGDIVVAMLGEEATVKTFYRESDRIRLQPENAALGPIYSRDVRIVGKVIALLRVL
ncbi:MAG: transcriptional repressor LexA [Coriobacteriales bacterium]|jgi:repressor LexA|nr:transcriptional repressor LexA [Coriobacteriales bacterium]